MIDGGSVRNLTVLGKVFHGYGSYDSDGRNDQFYTGSGGVAGYLKNGTIVNCVNYTRTTMDGRCPLPKWPEESPVSVRV